MAGPLIPQWVISNGPEDVPLPAKSREIFLLLKSVTVAKVDNPISPSILGSFILKVKSEGTGGTIVCPNFSIRLHTFGLLPVATSSLLHVKTLWFVSKNQLSFSLEMFLIE